MISKSERSVSERGAVSKGGETGEGVSKKRGN